MRNESRQKIANWKMPIWKFWHLTLSREMEKEWIEKNQIKYQNNFFGISGGKGNWPVLNTRVYNILYIIRKNSTRQTSPDKTVFRQFKLIAMNKNSLRYANQISTLWNFAQFVVASFGRLLVLTYWEKWNIWRFWTWVAEKQIYENLW